MVTSLLYQLYLILALYLSNIIIMPQDLLNFNTSASISIELIIIRKFSPTIIGKYYWNNIPLSIRLKSSKHSFKQSLFCYYFAQY